MQHQDPSADTSSRRIIKRYSNRKLYDTKASRYVTLAQIAEIVRTGEEVQIIDNATKEDKTEATLALIISEEAKHKPKAVPLNTLRELVHAQSEKLFSQLREGPIGRLFPGASEEGETGSEEAPAGPSNESQAHLVDSKHGPSGAEAGQASSGKKTRLQELVESSRHTFDQWQAAIDERIQAALPSFFRGMQDIKKDMRHLVQRLEEVEQQMLKLQNRTQGEMQHETPVSTLPMAHASGPSAAESNKG